MSSGSLTKLRSSFHRVVTHEHHHHRRQHPFYFPWSEHSRGRLFEGSALRALAGLRGRTHTHSKRKAQSSCHRPYSSEATKQTPIHNEARASSRTRRPHRTSTRDVTRTCTARPPLALAEGDWPWKHVVRSHMREDGWRDDALPVIRITAVPGTRR